MKKNSIKLSNLAEQALAEKEMAAIAGGDRKSCECACYYEDKGGANTSDNMNANYAGDKESEKGCNRVVKDDNGYGVIIQNHE